MTTLIIGIALIAYAIFLLIHGNIKGKQRELVIAIFLFAIAGICILFAAAPYVLFAR